MRSSARLHHVTDSKLYQAQLEVTVAELAKCNLAPATTGDKDAVLLEPIEPTPSWRERIRGSMWSIDAARLRAERYLINKTATDV